MPRPQRLLLPTLAMALTVLLGGCDPDTRALADFREQYARLHANGDLDGILEMIEIEDPDSPVLRQVRRALAEETRWPVATLLFQRIPAREARLLAENLPSAPRWRFVVTLDTEDRLTSVWLVGKTPGGLRILLP